MRLLLIEDDPMIGKAVREGLRNAGFAVDWVVDGRSAEASLADPGYDLALLDLGLPLQDGMQLLRKLRAGGATLPVLIASARDAVGDRIAGLNAGADDYVTKPFDLDERSEEHTSELQSLAYLVCRLLLEKKKNQNKLNTSSTTATIQNISLD